MVRVFIGNMFFKSKEYKEAIKMYKMALDMTPAKHAEVKFKIMKNIGHAYVKIQDLAEAICVYEEIMARRPDFETA